MAHELKTCSCCAESQPLSGFTKQSTQPDGLRRRCRKCDAAYQKRYYEAHKEELRDRSRQHRRNNLSYHRQYASAYQRAHSIELKEYQRAYRAANLMVLLAASRVRGAKWRAENAARLVEKQRKYRKTDIGRAISIASSQRRRRSQGVVVSAAAVKRILAAEVCHICKKRFSAAEPPTLDHVIPLALGGTHSEVNLAAAHGRCNSSKSSTSINPYTGQGFLL